MRNSKMNKPINLLGLLLLFLTTTIIFLESCSKEENSVNQEKSFSAKSRNFLNNPIAEELDDNQYKFLVDENELLDLFKELALEQDLGLVDYENLFIKKVLIENSQNEYFIGLFSSDINNIHNSAISLSINNRLLYLDAGNTGSITCSSTNCGDGCSPIQKYTLYGLQWTCSSCIPASNECKKTATVTIKP